MSNSATKKGVYIHTLGCKVNRYESEALYDLLCDSGRYFAVADEERASADVTVINSCMVTGESEKKARKLLRRVRRENHSTVILLCGCIPQVSPEKALTLGADIISGNKNRRKTLALLDDYFKSHGDSCINAVEPHLEGDRFELLAPKAYKKLTRANLKIQDGCNRFCAYCVIPYARGELRSMPLSEVFSQARALVESGHREIVLNGINLGLYGVDNGSSLAEAVRTVSAAGAERIRLGSLEVDLLTPELLKELSEVKGFCPQFHASLQSGSDTVLTRMHRRNNKEQYAEIIGNVKRTFENASITTDIIVGFEGETEAEFNECMEFCRQIGFFKIHVFPYSVREGTEAAKSTNQVPESVKKARAAQMARLGAELNEQYCNAQIGKTYGVLFEVYEGGAWYGHTENFLYVRVESDAELKNQLLPVVITAAMEGDDGQVLCGRLL